MSFKWYQNTSTVSISFVVPPSVKTKENLDVVITPTSIRAGPKGGPPVVEANLHGQLKPPGCNWSIKGNTAVIVLEKAAKARWPELFSKTPADSRKRVKVLYDYAAQDTVELTIKEDDILYVIKEDPSGWWKGELAGKVGLFPSNFVEELPPAKPMQEPPESPEPDPDPSEQAPGAEPVNPDVAPTPMERGGVPMPGLGGQDALAELKNKLANRKPTSNAPSKEPPKEPAPAPAPTRVALKPTRGPAAPKEPAPAPAPAPTRAAPKEPAPAPAPKEPAPAPTSNPPPATRGAPAPSRGAPASQPGPQPVKAALRPTKKEEPQEKAAPESTTPAPAAAPSKGAARPIAKQSTPPPSDSQGSDSKDDFKKKLEAQQKAALSGSGGARASVLISANSAETSSGTATLQASSSATDEGTRKASVSQKSKPAKAKDTPAPVPKCLAQYDYDAQADGELSFKEGDTIVIKLRDESGWWQGELNGQVGWFPANFVEELPAEAPPPEPEPAEEETVEEKLQEVVSEAPRLEAVKRVAGASGRKPPTLRKNRSGSSASNQNSSTTPAPAASPAPSQPAKTPAPAATPVTTQPKAKGSAGPTAALTNNTSNGESEVKRPALKAVKKAEPAPSPAKEEAPKQQPVALKKSEPSATPVATKAAPVPGVSQLRASRLVTSSSGNQQWPIELGGSFEEFCEELVTLFNDAKSHTKDGTPYQVIPSLSRQDPRWFGFGICSVDGKSYYHGDDVSFTLHGISWPMLYILAAEENGEDKISTLCGSEPGSIYGLNLTNDKKPQNPFVASGAIALASLIQNKNDELTRLMNVSDRFAAITGQQQLSSSIPSYLSLQLHASQEAMIAYNLKANNVLSADVDVKRVLDFYFQVCSIQTSVQQAAVGAATLANGGVCPTTNQKCFDNKILKKLGPAILNYGVNEQSESLGIPAQSSISGAVIAIIPKVMGLCVYAPGVDQSLVSSRALEFMKLVLEKFPTIKNFKF